MSLINQMLKDLEQRRANDLEVNNGTVQSVNRYIANNTGRQSGLLLGTVITLIVLLSILLGYLLWEKFIDQSNNETLSQTMVQQPEVRSKKQSVISKPKIAKTKPKLKPKSIKQPPVAIKNKPSGSDRTKEHRANRTTIANKTVPNHNQLDTETIDLDQAASDVVIKQSRALTAKQRAGLLYQKAYTNLQAGQVKIAEEQLRNSIKIKASYSRSRELLAGSYIRSGRYVEAGELLKQGLKVEPKNYHFAKLYARVLMQQEQHKQALDMLIRYRPALQADLEYFALIAALYQQTQQHNKAANMYKDLLQLQPGRGIWWVGLGVALEKTGNAAQARQAYSKAKESASLTASMRRYTDNKLAAIKDSGYPEQE